MPKIVLVGQDIRLLETRAEVLKKAGAEVIYCFGEQALDTVADLLTFLRVVPITGTLKAVPADPDDDKVLECAATVGATHIVTGDRRHLLPLGTFQGISILTAADFLALASSP